MNRRQFLGAAMTFVAAPSFTKPLDPSPLFDAHFHVVDPRFPLLANEGFVPDPFTVEDYRRRTAKLAVTGGAVVAGSFQGTDRAFLKDALEKLGPTFVGVVQLPFDVTKAELAELDRAGVRAVRLTVRRGASAEPKALERFGKRLHDEVGWHLEVYAGADALEALFSTLEALPKLSIDHLGLEAKARPLVLKLAAKGAQVKASGFGRVDFDVAKALREIAAVNPASLVFGTDLPSTRAPRPFRDEDVALVRTALGESGARRALHDNARAFYRPRR